MYLLQTVSTVPKSRPSNQSDTKFSINNYCGENFRTCQSQPDVKGRMPDCSKTNHYLKEKNANEIDFYKKKHNGIDSPRACIKRNTITNLNQAENEKKKEKKWTLGVFFRKKCKKNPEAISDDSEEDARKSFVIRQKCKKEKKKSKVNTTANGFDMIISSKKEEIIRPNKCDGEMFQVSKENDSTVIYQKPMRNSPTFVNNTPTRFIHRHPNNNFSESEKIKCNKECLQVSKNSRKNLNVSHISCLNNENADGRKCRKKVMARAEAKRDMICDDSSSDEYESFHSNSSLNKNNVDKLGARKLRRNKRLSRSDSFSPKSLDTSLFEKKDDSTLIKSNVEESIQFFSNLKKNTLPNCVDRDEEKLSVESHSKTVGVLRNSQKLQIIDSMDLSQTNTFPFVHCMQKNQNYFPTFTNLPAKNKPVYATENQNEQPYDSYLFHKNQSFISNAESNQLSNFPGLDISNNLEYKKLSNSDPFFSSAVKENYSFSQDISKENFFKNCATDVLQERPIKELDQNTLNCHPKPQFPHLNSRNTEELEVFEKKNEMNDFYFNCHVLPTYESQNKFHENSDVTPSVITQYGSSIPNQLTKNLQRSGSEHLFGDSKFQKSFEKNRSSSYQNIPISTYFENKNLNKKNSKVNETQTLSKMFSEIPNWDRFEYQTEFPPKETYSCSENSEAASMLRYYADLNPRSRNPIHITCDRALASREFLRNYKQVLDKPKKFSKQLESNVSAFEEVKDQKVLKNSFETHQENLQNSYKPSQENLKLNMSRSKSPRFAEVTNISLNQSFAHNESNIYEGQYQFKNFSLENDFKKNCKERSKLFEPPIRTLTQQEIYRNKNDQLKSQSNKKSELKNYNSNLNDALNELEDIYNDMKINDEDLISKPTKIEQKFLSNQNLRKPNQKQEENFDLMSDVFTEKLLVAKNISKSPKEKSNTTLPINKPDKIYDDMAFRRMNVKDRSCAKTFISPSYLRFSFTSPQIGGESSFQKKPSTHVKEPDVTYDDVVFRNIRHANNTLKVLDPQPPFGIPIGIFTPAPCSNYLDAVPKERFRPTFTSSKTPDVIKDDLAFRNLRKDNKSVINQSNRNVQNYSNLLKKRAIRSLSANISNIMHKKDLVDDKIEFNDNVVKKKKEEKSQSLTDLANDYEFDKEIPEKRLMELKEKQNNEFFEKYSEIKYKTGGFGEENLGCFEQSKSIKEIKNFDLNLLQEINKNNNLDSRLIFESKHSHATMEMGKKKSTKSSVVALSKYPAAAPLPDNTDKENTLDFFLSENKLESLLSVLDVEYAVNDLERQLKNLDSKPISENKLFSEDNLFSTTMEKFNKKFKVNSPEKVKRRRNLSLSNINELKVDDNWAIKTSSLERRKWPDEKGENLMYFYKVQNRENTINETSLKELFFKEKQSDSVVVPENSREILKEEPLAEKMVECCSTNKPMSYAFRKHLTSNSQLKCNAKEIKLNSPLKSDSEEVSEHSKQNVDVNQYRNADLPVETFVKCETSFQPEDTFQEIYEYNCQLIDKRNSELGNMSIGKKNEKLMPPMKVLNYKNEEHMLSDVEQEFEKLHEEQNKSTKNTKESNRQHNEFTTVDNDVDGINNNFESSRKSNFFLPFNKDKSCSSLKCKNRGDTPKSFSKREGEVKKDNLKTNLWLACTYALAFAFNFQQIDFLIALGTVLAVVLVIAILIL